MKRITVRLATSLAMACGLIPSTFMSTTQSRDRGPKASLHQQDEAVASRNGHAGNRAQEPRAGFRRTSFQFSGGA